MARWEAGPTGLGLFGCAFEGEGGIEAKGLACTAGKGDRPSNGAERRGRGYAVPRRRPRRAPGSSSVKGVSESLPPRYLGECERWAHCDVHPALYGTCIILMNSV